MFPTVASNLVRRGSCGLRKLDALRARRFLSTKDPKQRLAVLCILDGWGYNPSLQHNAVLQAHTPNFDRLWGEAVQRGSQAFMYASEEWVGLPKGQIGNSEVGHMNLGAGRRILQDLLAIDEAVKENTLKDKEALKEHIAKLKASGGTCHLMGLVSPGGVHAMQDHMVALANVVSKAGVPVKVHCFMDGRDVPPSDAINTLPTFLAGLEAGVEVATVTGRYYAMDRDNRWERVGQAYDVMTQGKGIAASCANPVDAIKQSYDKGHTDEFVEATVIGDYSGMKDGDGILMANFRADRAREILDALASPTPPDELGLGKDRPQRPIFADVAGMVQYSDAHKEFMSALFPVKDIQKPLGEVASAAGLRQLRIAETEKYPHVSFFFNGGREQVFEGEDRILVPSPKVATYDLQPEMSCPEVGKKVCEAVDSGNYNMVILNFANPDMVGHTGSLEAAVAACESVDKCLGDLANSVEKQGGCLITTADHGNCELMWDEGEGCAHTAHTLNRVPVILTDFTGEGKQHELRDGGALCDVAPTILEILGVPQPPEMSGQSLIKSN